MSSRQPAIVGAAAALDSRRATTPSGRLAILLLGLAAVSSTHFACVEPNLELPKDELASAQKAPRSNKRTPAPEPEAAPSEGIDPPVEDGRSTETGGCVRDLDCAAPGLVCELGKCVAGTRTPPAAPDAGAKPECTKSAECPLAKICTGGACVAGCTDSYDCELGTICTAGQCAAGCVSSLDCPSAKTCVAGQCKVPPPPPSCTKDSECVLGKICTASACVTGCRDSFDCALGSICTAGQCKVGCATSLDCPSTKSCVAGQCKTCAADAGTCP